MTPAPFEILEHTADVGFRAWGATAAELFENAGVALMSFTDRGAAERVERVVELDAEDYESLMVAWLNEVLFLFDAGQLDPAAFYVDEIAPPRLRAHLRGEARRGQWKLMVKAVTYHQIEVAQRNERWEATVYLDV